MKNWVLLGTTALCVGVLGSAARAQVTPEQVWQSWQDYGQTTGQKMTADSAVRNGDTLVVEGLHIAIDQPTGVKVSGTIDEVNFTDNGDGTVNVSMSDEYPLKVTVPAKPDEVGATPTDLTLTVTQPGLVMKASGSADTVSYAFDVPTIGVALEGIEGVQAEAVDLTMNITLTALTGTTTVSGSGDAKSVESTFAAASLSGVADGKDTQKEGTTFRMTANVANMAGASNGSLIGLAAMGDMAAALRGGLALDGNFTYGTNSLNLDVTEPKGPTKIAASGTGGTFNVSMDKSRMIYGAGGTGVKLSLSSPDIPFPQAEMAFAEAGVNFLMPLAKSEVPGDFSMLVKLIDLTLSDDIWGLMDPTAALPRDPATLIVDAKGKARLAVDLLDEAQTAALGDAPPGQIDALDITELRLSAAGSELTGAGAFTFDNTDTVTFGGVPTPTGKIDLKLVGGNGLLDKLAAMGLVPQDQVTGVRLMLSLFAQVTEGVEDTLTSTIEFKDKGLYANGQRLQ